MVTCDYLVIGSGFAGIALKYKLLGKTILIDKKPFSYKIGESHVPNLANSDPGVFSLIPKIMKMKSYTRKLGTVFCDSYYGKYASNFSTPLGVSFAWHCEREEIEKMLSKELSVDIKEETIIDIDLSKNLVKTNRNTYRFTKYLLDCSGPAMVLANKLNLVTPVDQFKGMKAQWSYWAIDRLNSDKDSWANWTVINKIGPDSWIWQIPLYNSSILSMGLLHRGEPLSNEGLIEYCKKYSAACYQLTSIAQNPGRAIKPYMKEVHSRFHYSKRSQKCCGDNWILVGDACCFADPVYSTGSGVAMLEAVTIANILNKNGGRFDHEWYEKKCNALIKTVIDGIGTWYSGTAFDKKVNRKVNRTILQGGFSRHFKPSKITDRAKRLQLDNLRAFLPSVEKNASDYLESMKVYYFNKSSFVKTEGSLSIINKGSPIGITNKNVQKVFEKNIIGKRFSYSDLYLIVELKLRAVEDKAYFWKVLRLFELIGSKNVRTDRLYYFHPEKYRIVNGQFKLGGQGRYLIIKDLASVKFFEKLTGKIFFGKELINLAGKIPDPSLRLQQDVRAFLKKFYPLNTFGRNFYV
jgi:flavin-dependent dehydrogenase